MRLGRTQHQAHIPNGQGPVVAELPGRAAHPSATCQSATPRAVPVRGQPGPHWPPARAGSTISHFHIQEVTAAVLIYNPEVWPWKLRVPACNALGSLHSAILPAPSSPKRRQECMLGSVVSSGQSHLLLRRAAQGPFLWAAPREMREQNPDTTNVRMSEGRALALPVTFWAVVSFQRPLPHDGLQVRQQVPLPLSLWELQVRV